MKRKNLEEFMNWLRDSYIKSNGERFKSWYNYGGYIATAANDLGISIVDFQRIQTPGFFKNLKKKLLSEPSFMKRQKEERSDINSGLEAYIKYLNTKI